MRLQATLATVVACLAVVAACGGRSELDALGDGTGDVRPGSGSGGTPSTCEVDGASCLGAADCCSGACNDGLCGEVFCRPGDPPEIIADGLVWPIGPVAAGDHVYLPSYDEDGALYRIRKDGSGTQTVAYFGWPHDVAVDADHLYVTTETHVVRLHRDQPGSTTELTTTFGGAGIGLFGDRVVWAEYFGMTVQSVSKSGGKATALASFDASPFRLRVHAGAVYVTAPDLFRIPLDGATPNVVGAGAVRSFDIDADGMAYMSQNHGDVHQVRTVDGTVLYDGDAFLDGVNVDGEAAYVFENGRVLRLAKDGSEPPQVLWEGDSVAGLMGQDRACLYVPIRPPAGPDDGDVLLRVAKP